LLDVLRGVLGDDTFENTTILTLGAGDIDTFVKPIGEMVKGILEK
jgi:hypothetical protein